MLKPLLPLGLLTLLATPAALAQHSTLGLRGGISWATYVGPGSAGSSVLAGGLGGLTVTTPLNQTGTVALETELLYSGKGAFLTGVTYAGLTGLSGTQRLHYLELPVLAQYRPGRVELEGGLQFGLLLAQRTELGGPNSRISSTGTGALRTFQGGAIVGAGYRLPQGLGLGLRYNRAFSSVNGGRFRSSVVQLQLSYQFRGA